MIHADAFLHEHFIVRELNAFFTPDTYAARAWKSIGAQLHYHLVDWPFEDEIEFSMVFPVEALFLWIKKDGGLDIGWLADQDGFYTDDGCRLIPPSVAITYSGIEQLAAYGLWLVKVLMDSLGPDQESEAGVNEQGHRLTDVREHRAGCMLLAYQALAYSRKLQLDSPLSVEEQQHTRLVNFRKLGEAGAKKRHAQMAALKEWAINLYKSESWPSANQAAHALARRIIDHGRTIGAELSEQNAQRTIAEWFRKSA